MFMQTTTNTDPDVLFFLQHNMSRAQMAARDREWAADRARAKALKGCDDDIPGATAREQLSNLHAKIAREEAEESALKAQDTRFRAAIDRPGEVKARRTSLLQSLAHKLLGGEESSGFDLLRRREMDSELEAARHGADVARLASADLGPQLEIKALRVKRLRERLPGFERDAMLEHIAETLGPKYVAAIAALRDVTQQIDAARTAAGMRGLEKIVSLPTFGLLDHAVIAAADHAAQAEWRKLIASWVS
jgi:hypothetical protein